MYTRRCHRRVTHRPPNTAAARGLLQAIAALDQAPTGLAVEATMAERERLRLEAEAQRQRQGLLWLRPAT